ncbi:MAG: glycosyltransferase family 4 protein, partial [Arcobacter sp.]|nr:glycosyltransferase family 4 protein [Arcobacter sp.]
LKELEIIKIKQSFLANENASKHILLKLKIPGLKTIVHNIRIVFETILLIKTIIKLKIDIIHLNHNIINDRAAALAGLLSSKKVISHDRGLATLNSFDRFLVRKIDQVICISDYIKQQYISFEISSSKYLTIYNGIDLLLYNNTLEKQDDKLQVGYIGRLELWKGVDIFIKTMPTILEEYKNIQFVIVGSGKQVETLKTLAKKLNVFNSIKFYGKINNIAKIYKSLDILVHTSIQPEPFGRVVIEGMANKLPVISTNIGGPIEIITHSKDGFLLPPGNSNLLSKQIIRLIKSSELRTQIGNNAFQKVKDNFDITTTTQNIEKLYNTILK